MSYTLDTLGNLERREDLVQGVTESYEHDALNRLAEVITRLANGTTLTNRVAYDAIGNITYKTGVGTYSYDAARPHAVVGASDGGSVYTYDDNGNMTSGATRTLTSNSANLLTKMSGAAALLCSESFGSGRIRRPRN